MAELGKGRPEDSLPEPERPSREGDVITLLNPTSEDFSHRYNGELYTIPAKETVTLAKFIAYHLAKHLAMKMVMDTFTQKDKTDRVRAVIISQHQSYDNPKLRKALYQILKDKLIVQDVIMAYPFKGFIGDMAEYEEFVTKEEAKKARPEGEGTPAKKKDS